MGENPEKVYFFVCSLTHRTEKTLRLDSRKMGKVIVIRPAASKTGDNLFLQVFNINELTFIFLLFLSEI